MNEAEVLWLDEHRVVSLTELVDLSGLTEDELTELVRQDLLPLRSAPGQAWDRPHAAGPDDSRSWPGRHQR